MNTVATKGRKADYWALAEEQLKRRCGQQAIPGMKSTGLPSTLKDGADLIEPYAATRAKRYDSAKITV